MLQTRVAAEKNQSLDGITRRARGRRRKEYGPERKMMGKREEGKDEAVRCAMRRKLNQTEQENRCNSLRLSVVVAKNKSQPESVKRRIEQPAGKIALKTLLGSEEKLLFPKLIQQMNKHPLVFTLRLRPRPRCRCAPNLKLGVRSIDYAIFPIFHCIEPFPVFVKTLDPHRKVS